MSSVAVRDDLVIGVDIGGTKVAAGLVDPSGEILCHNRNPMVSNDGAASGLAAVTRAIETASDYAARVAGAGGLGVALQPGKEILLINTSLPPCCVGWNALKMGILSLFVPCPAT